MTENPDWNIGVITQSAYMGMLIALLWAVSTASNTFHPPSPEHLIISLYRFHMNQRAVQQNQSLYLLLFCHGSAIKYPWIVLVTVTIARQGLHPSKTQPGCKNGSVGTAASCQTYLGRRMFHRVEVEKGRVTDSHWCYNGEERRST